MSVADDRLNATASRAGGAELAGWRAGHRPILAALLFRGVEVAAWIAFYVAVRALTD